MKGVMPSVPDSKPTSMHITLIIEKRLGVVQFLIASLGIRLGVVQFLTPVNGGC